MRNAAARAGPSIWPVLRASEVTPAVAVRSAGSTTAMVYDWRAGTSIDESAARARIRTTATGSVGATAAPIRNRLAGMWVKTMVRISPIRRASQAATGNEIAASRLQMAKRTPTSPGWAPKRSANQKAR